MTYSGVETRFRLRGTTRARPASINASDSQIYGEWRSPNSAMPQSTPARVTA